jgi:hypothetical protein
MKYVISKMEWRVRASDRDLKSLEALFGGVKPRRLVGAH